MIFCRKIILSTDYCQIQHIPLGILGLEMVPRTNDPTILVPPVIGPQYMALIQRGKHHTLRKENGVLKPVNGHKMNPFRVRHAANGHVTSRWQFGAHTNPVR